MRYSNKPHFFQLLITIILLSFLSVSAFGQYTEEEVLKAEAWADSVYHSFTLDEKIGQLIFARANQSGQPYLDAVDDYISNYNIGGVVFFRHDPISQALKTNEWNTMAKTPLFVAIDAEWGLGMRLSNTIKYPLQMTLGAIENNALLYQMGAEVAEQSKRMGIHINFAPVVDVNNNPANPVIGMRSFGENPENVALKAYHYMKGMQDHGLIACAKHFPGHGNTDVDSHVDLPVITASKNELKEVELVPFQYLIDKGVSAVMVAHLAVPALERRKNKPSSLSEKIVDGYLKNKMGFQGLIIPDGLDMQGITKRFKKNEVALEALKAGNDILLIPEDIPASIEAIKEAILKEKVSAERLEESCKKVLKYKYLSVTRRSIPVDTAHLLADLNKLSYKRTRAQLFSEAITVVSNTDQMIPLAYPDTLMPALIIIGTENETTFEKSLTAFLPFRIFRLSHDADVNQRQAVLHALEDYNLVVVAVVNTNILASKNYGITDSDVQFINHVARKKPVILNVFASPYAL
ncbi:MAG: glycoside hydrolase family 3 N-terminal domain-containing protein, partial [Bacteroidales bacterium]|nr:glycoside hydrolase family 3 N-terminal domain-containing protein [Bacteroidales bacterium]